MIHICLMTQILTSKSAHQDNSITLFYQNANNALKIANFAYHNLHVYNARASSIKFQLSIKVSTHVKNVIIDVTNALQGQTQIAISVDIKR